MNEQWYYNRGGQQQGPVSREQLQQLAIQGHVGRGDMVWTQSLGDWRPAEQVPGLLPPGAPASPYASPYAAPRRTGAGGGFPYLMLLIGGGLMLVAFALPWWYFTLDGTEAAQERANKASGGNDADNRNEAQFGQGWFGTHYSPKELEKMDEDMRENRDEDTKKVTQRLWGWRVWPAFFGLMAALLIIPSALIGVASPRVRRSIFVLVFAAALMAAVATLSAAIWFIGAPGVSITSQFPNLSMGCHFGVYIMIAASALVAVFGLMVSLPLWRAAAAKLRDGG